MNIPSVTLKPLTGINAIDSLTNGTYWVLDNNRTLTWALSDFGSYGWTNPTSAASDIAQAYSAFSQFIPINFSYVGNYAKPNTAPADLVISLDGSNTFFSSANVWAEGFFPNAALDNQMLPSSLQGIYTNAPGDIWINLNSQLNTQASYGPGTIGFAAFLHEIGHTLGLKHPHDDGGTGHPTFSTIGALSLDMDWYTIMSYNDSYPLSNSTWHPATPMIGDVIALQSIYGINSDVHKGNDNYQVINNNMFQTIFDPAGTNTLDMRTSAHAWSVNLSVLSPGAGHPYEIGLAAPSDEPGLSVPTSLYWLYGDFKNIYCSNQNDNIVCAPTGNTVYLGNGSETVSGGVGWDICVIANTKKSFSITQASGSFFVKNISTNAVCQLTNVERAYFSDAAVAFDLSGNAGEAYRIYQAAFNRSPDLSGLGYWIASMDSGLSLRDVAIGFINSAEFHNIYGENPSNSQIATGFYQNVLHRVPDAAGLAYWVDLLNNRSASFADVLIGFSESAENRAALIGVMGNGISFIPYH